MNLLSLLAGLTKRDPHALIAIDADPGLPVHVSRSELWRRTLQLRADLATAGVGRGDGVAVWLPNWSVLLDWHIAAASLGAHVVGLDPRSPADAIAPVLGRTRPRVVALATGLGHDLVEPLRQAVATSGAPVPAVSVVAGPHRRQPIDPSPWDVGGGAWLPSATTAGMPMPQTRGDELAVAFAPGLAAYRESVVVRHAQAAAAALGIRDDDLVACSQPITTVPGFGLAVAALAGGAGCLLEPGCDEDTLLDDMARFGATHLAVDDGTAHRLAEAWRRRHRDLPTWRWFGVTGAPEGAPEASGWAEKEFGVTSTGVHGSSEVLLPAAVWPDDAPTPRRWQPGGRPVSPELEVRVADPVSGQALPPGEQGELQFRGQGVVDAVLGSPEPAAPSLTADGWFPTGSLGVLTEDGGFRSLGGVGDQPT
ncbi:AMP-binding protein [Prauserella cavernicola]|uniref:AMP-binding protein n=1 Tax=Prauserella cavernicola TaxID=2800127 RepID=A0A934QYA7_9PSEU|nr:AMP-binding protein [Prauserella cavernicola]MBK1788778.1 AMP-binding protein [Prauserella cavernicola]